MRVAIIGSGISGMAAGWYLSPAHEVTLYEAGPRLGGHTATIDVEKDGERHAIDTGFIVCNDRTYPHFLTLMDQLGIVRQPTSMSFSVSDIASGLEYAGSNLDGLFAQRRNVVSPRFWRMLRDILRFNSDAEMHLERDATLAEATLGEYLDGYRYSREFRDLYLIPMGAAIWSAGDAVMDGFPLRFFLQFFRNHGLLDLRNRPQWYSIMGGSRQYIAPLVRPFADRIHLDCPVRRVLREQLHEGRPQVSIDSARGREYYDAVVFACHSDQALGLLGDPTPDEWEILGAIPYSRNEVVLHTDASLLPRSQRAWSSWNVRLDGGTRQRPALSYNMNILQRLESRHTWVVTLNDTAAIRQESIVGVYHYDHPVFSMAGVRAQARWPLINGVNGTWFCGAWWRNGFHEDGVWSARRVADHIAGNGGA